MKKNIQFKKSRENSTTSIYWQQSWLLPAKKYMYFICDERISQFYSQKLITRLCCTTIVSHQKYSWKKAFQYSKNIVKCIHNLFKCSTCLMYYLKFQKNSMGVDTISCWFRSQHGQLINKLYKIYVFQGVRAKKV